MTAMYRVTILTLFIWTSKAAVKYGADVTLHCQSPRDANITLLEWNRPDLKTDDYVFLYRNGRPYEQYQHESFHGRVQLKDPQMKNGDVSVILKNVNTNDTGTYECRVSVRGKESDLINTIILKVSGKPSGVPVGLIVGLTVAGVIAAVVVVFLIYKFCKRKNKSAPLFCWISGDEQAI